MKPDWARQVAMKAVSMAGDPEVYRTNLTLVEGALLKEQTRTLRILATLEKQAKLDQFSMFEAQKDGYMTAIEAVRAAVMKGRTT